MSGRTLRRVFRTGGDAAEADLRLEGDRLLGRVRGEPVEAHVARVSADTVTVRVGEVVHHALVAHRGDTAWVAIDGRVFEMRAADVGAAPKKDAEPFAVSPMTGVVAKVAVRPGDHVASGGALFVVEAMKMEYVVKAPRDVRVGEVRRRAGEKVTLGEIVVTFEEAT